MDDHSPYVFLASCIILEKSVGSEKDAQGGSLSPLIAAFSNYHLGVHGESITLVVYAMEGENPEVAFCHLIGDEKFFWFARFAKSLCGRPPW